MDFLERLLAEFGSDQRALRDGLTRHYKRKLKRKFGESAYTIPEISSTLVYLGFDDYDEGKIWSTLSAPYITFSGVFSNNPTRQREGFPFILRSNLQRLLDKMELPIDAEDLELSARHLGYKV